MTQEKAELLARRNGLIFVDDNWWHRYCRTIWMAANEEEREELTKRKPILCLDFDGVLHSYQSGWQGADKIPDRPVPGAAQFIREAAKHFKVVIFSSRSNQTGGIEAMRRWMMKYGMPVESVEFVQEKPPAMLTLDDRAQQFVGEWPSMEELLSFEPWTKWEEEDAS